MNVILRLGPYLDLNLRSESSTSKDQYTASTTRSLAVKCDDQVTK